MAKRKRDISEGRSGTDDLADSGSASPKRSRKEKASSGIVDDANKLGWQEFTDRFWDSRYMQFDYNDERSFLILTFANDLKSRELDQCLNLIESTSRKDYEASTWGWHPKRKRREMKEEEMRYLLVRKHRTALETPDVDNMEFEGFLSFMLTHDSSPSVPVLYVYEIHLTEAARGKGVGVFLMNAAESFASGVGVDKVMLTCFLSNTNAHGFYKRLGFKTDACSPEDRKTRNKVVKVDYVIMSKDVRVEEVASLEDSVEVTEEQQSDITSACTNEIPSLDECPRAMRFWTKKLNDRELLGRALDAADFAKQHLCDHNDKEADYNRLLLNLLHRTLQTRYEAARDLSEVLRDQMYHIKSEVSDVNRLAATLSPSLSKEISKTCPGLSLSDEDEFDMERATGQVYSALHTLLRKAEEVDNRLDSVALREEEASMFEGDLDQREEELDSFENDLHEREKALADREERFMRSRRRLQRRGTRVRDAEKEESPEEEQVRALPWRQESLPRDKVTSWLRRNTSDEDILVRSMDASV